MWKSNDPYCLKFQECLKYLKERQGERGGDDWVKIQKIIRPWRLVGAFFKVHVLLILQKKKWESTFFLVTGFNSETSALCYLKSYFEEFKFYPISCNVIWVHRSEFSILWKKFVRLEVLEFKKEFLSWISTVVFS